MSDQTTDMLRRTMKAITEITPEAPVIETVSDSPGWRRSRTLSGVPPSGWRGPATALVAAAVVLVVVGVGAIGTTLLRSGDSTRGVTGDPTAVASVEGWVVMAFLADNADTETIMNALATRPGAIGVRYVTKSEAYAEAFELFADDQAMIRVLEEIPDLIPASIRVLTDGHARSQALASDAAEMAGVVATDLYFGTLEEYGLSVEEILASYGPASGSPSEETSQITDTTTTLLPGTPIDLELSAFMEEPLIHDPVVVFLTADPDESRRDEFVAVIGVAGSTVGASLRETLTVRARERLKQDDEALALLDEYPEIIEPLIWRSSAISGANRQRLVEQLSTMSGVAAVQSVAGLNTIADTDLPDDAIKLRSWWRAQMYREIALTCCNMSSVADGELRAFLVGLTPLERSPVDLEEWRQIAQDACTNTPLSDDLGMDAESLTAELRVVICRELIPWRAQPLDDSTRAASD